MLNEAAQLGGVDLPILCASADDGPVEEHLLSTLLPHAFGPSDLG
jgi:cytidine deaminase